MMSRQLIGFSLVALSLPVIVDSRRDRKYRKLKTTIELTSIAKNLIAKLFSTLWKIISTLFLLSKRVNQIKLFSYDLWFMNCTKLAPRIVTFDRTSKKPFFAGDESSLR